MDDTQVDDTQTPVKTPSPEKTPSKNRRSDEACSEIIKYLREKNTKVPAVQQQEPPEYDEDSYFCRSVESNLRKMTESQNATAKFYIQQILMEVRFNLVPQGVRRITNEGNTANNTPSQAYDGAYAVPSTSYAYY